MALVDPWCATPGKVGIPGEIMLPSFKGAGRARGTFMTGTTGMGFIALNPFGVSNNSVLTDNGFSTILKSDATYAPSTPAYHPFTGTSTFNTGVSRTYLDTPFPVSLFAGRNGLKFRVVGAGIKVRYIGPEMYRSGRIFAYREATNQGIVDGQVIAPGQSLSVTAMTTNKETAIDPVTRKYFSCLYKPAKAEDLVYNEPDNVLAGYPAPMLQGPSMLLFVDGASTTPLAFEYDIIVHYELVGANLPFLSLTPSDPVGKAAIVSALTSSQPTTDQATWASQTYRAIGEHLQNFSGQYSSAISQGAASLGAAAIAGTAKHISGKMLMNG